MKKKFVTYRPNTIYWNLTIDLVEENQEYRPWEYMAYCFNEKNEERRLSGTLQKIQAVLDKRTHQATEEYKEEAKREKEKHEHELEEIEKKRKEQEEKEKRHLNDYLKIYKPMQRQKVKNYLCKNVLADWIYYNNIFEWMIFLHSKWYKSIDGELKLKTWKNTQSVHKPKKTALKYFEYLG